MFYLILFVIGYGITVASNWIIWFPSLCKLRSKAIEYPDAKSWFAFISPETENNPIWNYPKNKYILYLNKFHKAASSFPVIVLFSLFISLLGPISFSFALWWWYNTITSDDKEFA